MTASSPHFTRRKILLALGIVAGMAIVWLLICVLGPERVEVASPTRGPAVQAVYATGTVEATVMMPIAPRMSARLMELNVDEGSAVTKGQQLARLEDEDLQQTIKELQAREEYARTELERAELLVKRRATPKSEVDRTRAEWESAKAAVARAATELDYMKLIAPAEGHVIRRDGEVGQLIPANTPVFWMSCCAPLRISSEVDEEDISLVQPGQNVLIRADAFPGKTFDGTVLSITPKGDPVARSYRVRIGFTKDNPLLIGMTAETNIITRESKDALLIPSSAVEDGKVWLVKDGELKQRKVEIGAKASDKTEILSGVSMEDEVVINPTAELEEGKSVRAVTP